MVRVLISVGLVFAAVVGAASVRHPDTQPAGDKGIAAKVVEPERKENYEETQIGGFHVYFNKVLLADDALTRRVKIHIEADLDQIRGMIPAPAFKELSSTSIWVEKEGTRSTANVGHGLCCHWSPGWLREHGVLAEKVGGVEIMNPQDFINWRRDQPYMLFHELSHALHWQHPKLDAEIEAVYAKAMAAKLYDAVPRNTVPMGKTVKAYAATNSHEYFAELSEAYFALNDFYPFTRPQLQAHDPAGFALLERVWHLQPAEFEAVRGPRT